MNSTETRGANLAICPTQPVEPRLAHRRRLVAFAAMFSDAERQPQAVYGLTRKQPRVKLPDERERRIIHQAIRDGKTTPERVIHYRLFQLQDDLAQFDDSPALQDLLYLELVREQIEAIDAQSLAHAIPTPAHLDAAVRETEEASLVGRAFCALVRSGRLLMHRTATGAQA